MTNKPIKAKKCRNPSCREIFTPLRPLQVVCSPACGFKISCGQSKASYDAGVLEEAALRIEQSGVTHARWAIHELRNMAEERKLK
jgi:hypothetical protein